MVVTPEDPDRQEAAIDRRLATTLGALPRDTPIARVLRRLLDDGLDRLPLPGHGATLKRWQALETVARHDLALVKLFESHTDALAILNEIDTRHAPRPGVLYAVWASEARVDPIVVRARDEATADEHRDTTHVLIDGRKSWCSGAEVVDAALMTATAPGGLRYLVEVRLASPGIRIDRDRWQAVGMQGSGSFDVVCTAVPARIVGPVGGYLDRPGFWHGGAGVAACWYGAAAAVGSRVRDLQVGRDEPHALAHLGAIDAALAAGAALLRETAAAIDAAPARDAMRVVLRARGAVADLTEVVLHHALRAIGPGPLCNEPDLARHVADLPVFVRQCRAEHDQVAQARALLADAHAFSGDGWTL